MNKSDRELCDWLAVHVMGFVRDELENYASFWRTPDGKSVFASWNPVEDANDTQRVKQAIIDQGYSWEIDSHVGPNKTWVATVLGKLEGQSFSGQDANELRAVCMAAKAAIKESE